MLQQEFAQFYKDNIDKAFRFIYLRVDSLETAQDLTSLVFLKFYEFLKDKNKEKKIKDKKAFLYRMVRNLLTDFYRNKEKMTLSLNKLLEEKGLDFPLSFDIQNKIETNWEMERIKKSLNEINPLYKEVIIFHYINDLSIKEIASILGKTENNTRVLLHRALESLKTQINMDKNTDKHR